MLFKHIIVGNQIKPINKTLWAKFRLFIKASSAYKTRLSTADICYHRPENVESYPLRHDTPLWQECLGERCNSNYYTHCHGNRNSSLVLELGLPWLSQGRSSIYGRLATGTIVHRRDSNPRSHRLLGPDMWRLEAAPNCLSSQILRPTFMRLRRTSCKSGML